MVRLLPICQSRFQLSLSVSVKSIIRLGEIPTRLDPRSTHVLRVWSRSVSVSTIQTFDRSVEETFAGAGLEHTEAAAPKTPLVPETYRKAGMAFSHPAFVRSQTVMRAWCGAAGPLSAYSGIVTESVPRSIVSSGSGVTTRVLFSPGSLTRIGTRRGRVIASAYLPGGTS